MLEWVKAALTSSATGAPSTKRTVIAASAGSILAVLLWIGAACAWWIYRSGDLGTGAVAALSFIAGIAAGLAGVAYRKPEAVGVEAPPAGGGTAPGTSLASATGPTAGGVGAADPGKTSVAP